MSQKCVLVVDDSKSARYAMRMYLQRLGCAVETASSASEAYRMLENKLPDLIFLDNVMPGETGLQALTQLRQTQRTAKIPVVFCTSLDSVEFERIARARGANEVMHKPPSSLQLSTVLAQLDAPQPATDAPHAAGHTASLEPAASQAHSAQRQQIDQALRRLSHEVFVQIDELRQQIQRFETASASRGDVDAFKTIAQDETETLYSTVRTELDAIRQQIEQVANHQAEDRRRLLQAVGVLSGRETVEPTREPHAQS